MDDLDETRVLNTGNEMVSEVANGCADGVCERALPMIAVLSIIMGPALMPKPQSSQRDN